MRKLGLDGVVLMATMSLVSHACWVVVGSCDGKQGCISCAVELAWWWLPSQAHLCPLCRVSCSKLVLSCSTRSGHDMSLWVGDLLSLSLLWTCGWVCLWFLAPALGESLRWGFPDVLLLFDLRGVEI